MVWTGGLPTDKSGAILGTPKMAPLKKGSASSDQDQPGISSTVPVMESPSPVTVIWIL